MTEKKLVETLSKKGFTETTTSIFQNERIFTATDIYGKEITITFDKGKDSYDKVSMKVSDEIIQTPIDVEIGRVNKLEIQPPESSTSREGGQEEPTTPEGNLMDVPDSQDSTEFKENEEEGASSKFSLNIRDIATNAFSTIKSGIDTITNNISYNNLSNKEESTFNVDSYETLKGFKLKVDLEDVKTLRDKVIDAADYFNVDIIKSIDDVIISFEEMNPKTKERLQSTIDLEYLTLSLSKEYRSAITEGFNDLISELTENIRANGAIDENASGSTNSTGTNPEYTGGHGSGGGHGGGSTDTPSIDDITPQIPTNQDNLNMLTPAIAGMVAFTEVVSMYTSIGAENSVQSSLTGNYGLLGLVHQNDKYYYKIIDKTTGQVYFVEMNDKAKITWDDRGERQAIEIIGDNAFVMKLPQEGEVLVRTASVGDVYFLNGEKMTYDGIDYYNISDNVTGEVAYIPFSSGVSEPTLVSNLGSTTSSDSSSEVIQ